MDAVVRKKLEELEARVSAVLPQNPAELPSHDLLIYQIRRRVDFIKTLLTAESESNSRDKSQHLEEIGERLSVLEKNFVEWANSGGKTENQEEIAERLSFIESNFSYLNTSEAEEDEDQEEEEAKEIVSGVTEEKIREELGVILSKVNIEKMVAEVTEKANKKAKERGGWFRRIRTMGAAVVVAGVGLAIASFGSVEESVYLVPT